MFTVPSEKEEDSLRERGVSIPKKENIGRNAASEEVGNSGSVPSEEEGLTIPSKGTNETPCSGGNSGSIPSEEEGLTIPSKGHMNHPVLWGKF